jgi:hypothetical protein
MSSCKIKKKTTDFQQIMAKGKHSHCKSEAYGIERRDGTKGKPKTSRENVKYYSSIANIQGIHDHGMSSQELGKPHPWDLASCRPQGLSPGWLCSLTVAFLDRSSTFLAIPGISDFLGSSLQFHLHSQQYHTLFSQGLPAGILILPHTAWLPRPSFEISVEASMTPHSCILHSCEICTMWTRSATSASDSGAT